jgi:hypothetical protein
VTIKINAAGPIAPLGRTTVHGTLRIVGGVEAGTLLLESSGATLPLQLGGAASPADAPSALSVPFGFNGRMVAPNTLFSYQPAEGSGTLSLTLAPGIGRVRAALVFHSTPPGGPAGRLI